MKENNLLSEEVRHLTEDIRQTYDMILQRYSKMHHIPLGISDCHVYVLALSMKANKHNMGVEDLIEDLRASMHPDTYLFVLYSLLDISITLKLGLTPNVASKADAAYEICRSKGGLSHDLIFMSHYMHGWLISSSIDDDQIAKDMPEEWFRICLLALDSYKQARRYAIIHNVNIPVREALLDLQINTIQMAIVNPKIKKGLTLGSINVLSYNHNISISNLRESSEPVAAYLTNRYKAGVSEQMIKTPYHFDPINELSL